MTIVAIEEKDSSESLRFAEIQQMKQTIARLQIQLREKDAAYKTIRHESEQFQYEKKLAVDEVAALREQFSILKQKLFDFRKDYSQLNVEKSTLEKTIVDLEATIISLKEENESQLRCIHDVEDTLEVAHQHLAKKVREVSELSDTLEVERSRIVELCDELEREKNKVESLKESLVLQIDQEKETVEKLTESQQSAESMALSWEEKYHQLYEKVQENEVKIQTLKEYEKKYNQMQVLWNSLGHILGGEASNSHQSIKPIQSPLANDGLSKKHYQNLYDISQTYSQ